MERKLATIMAADVVGYGRLMEQDEAGTFERLRAHRKDCPSLGIYARPSHFGMQQ
jgi:class 3 adenylate cyclase